jgi:L-asparaginase
VDKQKILVLGTGGTIAGTADRVEDNIGYTAAQLGVAQLLEAIPELALVLQGCRLDAEQVAQLDSKDMDFGTWRQLALRCAQALAEPDVRAIIVTHGTDTLEETAFFLQAVLQPVKPVVLTCAMRPATALVADGPQNVLDAVTVALDSRARGVLAVCAGVVHGARDVQKVHTYRLDAFGSGDAGPLGHVEERAVRWLRDNPPVAAPGLSGDLARSLPAVDWPRVEIVMSYVGASALTVEALVHSGVAGLVLAGTGNGSLHQELETALRVAQRRDVKVLRSTRCALGQVLPKPGDTIADAGGLSPVKARVALLLDLLAARPA